MKNLIYFLLPFLILISNSFNAQVDITIEPCVQAKEALSKEEKKKLIKAAKSKRELPESFYTEDILVFILNSKTSNIDNVIAKKPKAGDYSFNKTIEEAKEACKSAGLKVTNYIIDYHQDDLHGNKLISATLSEEDLKMVKNSGSNYYVMIAQNIGIRQATARPGVMEDKNGVYAKVININDPLDIFTLSIKDLAKSGIPSNYKEGKTTNRISTETTYGGQFDLPTEIKISKIYFINNPNLILPSSKPKGLMCRMTMNYYQILKDDYIEQNAIAKKELKKCKVDFEIVDKESEIKTGNTTYALKYHEKTSTNTTGSTSKIEMFYLENTITKKVYAFKSGVVSHKYDKYFQKVIKEINEH